VRLPRLPDDAAEQQPAATDRSRAAPEPVPRRILVVDDREPQSQSLKILLESFGHEVRVANDGPSTIAIALDFVPDAALIDIGLPGMSGYEVARRLRQEPSLTGMLLIAQTGWGRDEDRQRARDAGFDYHMTKPLDHEELFRLLSLAGRQK